MNHGIICSITNRVADFEDQCDIFDEDVDLVSRLKRIDSKTNSRSASQGKRVANMFLDTLFYYIFCVISGYVIGIVLYVFSPSSMGMFNGDNNLLSDLLAIMAYFAYYSTMEALTGRTLAKLITKTKVVDENGIKPDYSRILLRTVCRLIPFDGLSFLGEENKGWHDQFSKTRVVEG